jgi:hypothetical protein
MNPVTRSLLAGLREKGAQDYLQIEAFVDGWDMLEELVVSVFRAKSAREADRREYHRLRTGLLDLYPTWGQSMQPFWQETRVAGQRVQADPFLALLAIPNAGDFIGNWTAMQTLPAAREALNHFLLDRMGEG